MKDILRNKMLLALFLTNTIFATIFPMFHKLMIDNIDYEIMSIEGIILAVLTIVMGSIWVKYEEILYSYYKHILYCEIIFYVSIILLLNTGVISYSGYYLLDTILVSTIGKAIGFGNNTLKSKYFKDLEERKIYDNKKAIISSIGALIGYSVSYVCKFNLPILWMIILFGVSIDNVIYIMIYNDVEKE